MGCRLQFELISDWWNGLTFLRLPSQESTHVLCNDQKTNVILLPNAFNNSILLASCMLTKCHLTLRVSYLPLVCPW